MDNILKIFITGYFILILSFSIVNYHTTEIKFLRYNRVPLIIDNYLEEMGEYIIEKENDHHVYLFLTTSSVIKIYLNDNLTFTDLINQGNLGSNEYKYIDNIDDKCQRKKCLFILDKDYFNGMMEKNVSQINPIFKDYALKNHFYLETLPSGNRVYINYEKEPEN